MFCKRLMNSIYETNKNRFNMTQTEGKLVVSDYETDPDHPVYYEIKLERY